MNGFLRRVVFPAGPTNPYASDWVLLVLRLIVGGLMIVHGFQKVFAYSTLVNTFPDPIGLGGALSLQLAILAEFLCSFAVIFGFIFRLALIPIIVTMVVAGFVVMLPMGWSGMELPVLYLLLSLLLIVAGPGRYSLDWLIVRRWGGSDK